MNRIKIARTPLCILFLITAFVINDVAAGGDDRTQKSSQWLNGYQSSLEGKPFPYHSPLPDTKSALLLRCSRNYPAIAWETSPAPADKSSDWIHFVWLFGIDANPETHNFTLHVNDETCLTFQNPATTDLKEWSVSGKWGAELRFRATLTDRHQDLMGFAFLRLPSSKVEKGKPVRLSVVGDNSGSPVWYMTFQRSLVRNVTIDQAPAVIKKGDGVCQKVFLDYTHLGEPSAITIDSKETGKISRILSFGQNRISFDFPVVDEKCEIKLNCLVEREKPMELSFVLNPPRKWTIYLVQHSHTDIGYTRPQTEILPEHLRFIDYALDYCDLTDSYPDDARFRWTCESTWAVREYIKRRPVSQVERLMKRIGEGRIEITGMMFNLSELPDEASLCAFLNPLRSIIDAGVSVTTAMQNDVNGIAWCLADYLSQVGVKYLIMGQHSHRALASFSRPTPFWWESPSGSRILAFRADHYMTGNTWGLHSLEVAPLSARLFDYLQNLDNKGYPLDSIAVQYSGYLTDNAPPSTKASDLIRKWNETYEWPKLKSAIAREFMDHVAENHAEGLPVYRAAWPDWWTDGFGSAARETAMSRKTHSDLIATQALFAMAVWHGLRLPEGYAKEMQSIYDALLFYDEHTFGAAESIRDPNNENSMVQWGEKSAYVWTAVKGAAMMRETALGLLQEDLPRADTPTISVFNTLNWKRSGLHTVYIDHQMLPPDRRFSILDQDDKPIAVQHVSSRSDGSYWALWAKDVPPLGYKTYRIAVEKSPRQAPHSSKGPVLENNYYRIEINPKTGAILSLVNKTMDMELVDKKAEWGFLSFIHEQLNSRNQLERFTLDSYKRSPLQEVSVKPGSIGPIWSSLKITGSSDCCIGREGVSCEVRLFHTTKKIEFHFNIRKKENTEPEGVYVAFPFALPGGKIAYEAQGGMVTPGENQMPGSSSDWHTIQNYAVVKNNESQIILGSCEIPLAQFGDINLGKFQYIAKVEKPHIYSWVMNNYWTTNFKASQEGEFNWSYYLTTTDDTLNSAAAKFGWGCRTPFISRVLPPVSKGRSDFSLSLLDSDTPHLLLVSARPSFDTKGVIFQWRELNGVKTDLDLNIVFPKVKERSVFIVNPIGEILSTVDKPIAFKPFEVKFVKIVLSR